MSRNHPYDRSTVHNDPRNQVHSPSRKCGIYVSVYECRLCSYHHLLLQMLKLFSLPVWCRYVTVTRYAFMIKYGIKYIRMTVGRPAIDIKYPIVAMAHTIPTSLNTIKCSSFGENIAAFGLKWHFGPFRYFLGPQPFIPRYAGHPISNTFVIWYKLYNGLSSKVSDHVGCSLLCVNGTNGSSCSQLPVLRWCLRWLIFQLWYGVNRSEWTISPTVSLTKSLSENAMQSGIL